MLSSGDAFQHHLLDEDYWAPRLQRLRSEPRGLVQVHRQDLSRPGFDVVELNVNSHDGTPLKALLARSAFHQNSCSVHLRTCGKWETCAIDWKSIESGISDLVFPFPPDRRLEDRVLDVLRLVQVASGLETIENCEVRLYSGVRAPSDEFVIADLVRGQAWY